MNTPNTKEQYLEGLGPVPTEEQMRSLIEKVKIENPELEKRELFNSTVKELLNPPHKMLVFRDGETISISLKNTYFPKGHPEKSFKLEDWLKIIGDEELGKEDPKTLFYGPTRNQILKILKEKNH